MPSKLSTDPKIVCNSSYNCEKGPNPRVLMNARNALETIERPQNSMLAHENCEKGPNPRVFMTARNALETVDGPQNSIK